MARSDNIRRRIVYQSDGIRPEDLLAFIELRGFSDDWKRLGLDDDDLLGLQVAIMAGPRQPPVVAGTDGLRKIRFAPRRWKTGKSGAVRVGYVYFEEFGIVLLVVAYAKNEQDDLSASEKRAIRDLIRRQKQAFETRRFRKGEP